MALFPFPKISRFCFCTRSLKCAAVTTIIVGMISSLHRIFVIYKPQCKTLYSYQTSLLMPLLIFSYLFFLFELLLLTISFVLLLSIFFKPMPIAADIYIICALLTELVSIIFSILYLVQGVIANCGFQAGVLNFIVYVVVWTYFVFVINTYRDKMTED